MSAPLGYDAVRALAQALQRPASTLTVLKRDPFYASKPAEIALARWFADQFRRLGCGHGIHLRRIHYHLVSQKAPVVLPGGATYGNTIECWKTLTEASLAARYLGLVPLDAFVDRRNPEPQLFARGDSPGEIAVEDAYPFDLDLPESLTRPTLALGPQRRAQPYLVELWCEKSTVNDVLLPLGQRYDCNVVTAAGEFSLTGCRDLVRRALTARRPVRILYISDFDPAGQSMPVAIARKVEWCLHEAGLDLDIQVRPVALTEQQCIDYRLPRTPIKESESRAARFEERFGEGATELDALEALRPGELRRLIKVELDRYHDHDLRERENAYAETVEEELTAIVAEVLAAFEDELADFDAAYAAARDGLVALRRRAARLWEDIAQRLEAAAPDAGDLPWPEPAEGDEDPAPLFDSRRDFLTQVAFYKAFQGRPTGRRSRSGNGGGNGP